MKRNILLLFTFFACITVQGQTPVRLVDLRSEHLDRPIGLDNPVPRLSWRMEDGRQGAVQTSWRIVVDEDSLNVVNGCGRMWDSGKNDSRNQLVAYAGKKLQPFTRYYWKVICSDMEYKETASPVSYLNGHDGDATLARCLDWRWQGYSLWACPLLPKRVQDRQKGKVSACLYCRCWTI